MSSKELIAFLPIGEILANKGEEEDDRIYINGVPHRRVCFVGMVEKVQGEGTAWILSVKDDSGTLDVNYISSVPPGNTVMVLGQFSPDGGFYAEIVREIDPIERKALEILIRRFKQTSSESETESLDKEFEEFELEDEEKEQPIPHVTESFESLDREFEMTMKNEEEKITEKEKILEEEEEIKIDDSTLVEISKKIVDLLWNDQEPRSIDYIANALNVDRKILKQVLKKMEEDNILKEENGLYIME